MPTDLQEILRVVDALLATCDENGRKERKGLEECALAFEKATEGDLSKRLDALTQVVDSAVTVTIPQNYTANSLRKYGSCAAVNGAHLCSQKNIHSAAKSAHVRFISNGPCRHSTAG